MLPTPPFGQAPTGSLARPVILRPTAELEDVPVYARVPWAIVQAYEEPAFLFVPAFNTDFLGVRFHGGHLDLQNRGAVPEEATAVGLLAGVRGLAPVPSYHPIRSRGFIRPPGLGKAIVWPGDPLGVLRLCRKS